MSEGDRGASGGLSLETFAKNDNNKKQFFNIISIVFGGCFEWFGNFYGPSRAHEAVSGGVAPRKNEPCGRGASEKMTLPFTLLEPAQKK